MVFKFSFSFLGSAGSSLLCGPFSNFGKCGQLSSCSARTFHCGGFSCCRAQALGCVGFSSCGSKAPEHRLNSCRAWTEEPGRLKSMGSQESDMT